MNYVLQYLIGVLVLLLGIPIGNLLAKWTKEELKSGQVWFKAIVWASLLGVFVSFIVGNDVFLFGFAFISIVTSRSLKLMK